MKIGVMVESFREGLDGGLQAAVDIGAQGVQISSAAEESHPDKLIGPAREQLRRRVEGLGLEVSAYCADFRGHGFARAEDNPQRLDEVKKSMDLARELGTTVVTGHIGVVPADKAHPRYAVMAKACEEAARYGESVGATYAIETGPETADVLRALLEDVGIFPGLGVNFDPANLKMVYNADIVESVTTLGPYIVHTHAKDGRNLQPVDAEKLYASFAEGGIEGFNFGDYIMEDPLGKGDVNFDTYLPALRATGFDGYLTIEREVGDNPRADIEMAVQFLKNQLEK